jgi:hypothetical protein
MHDQAGDVAKEKPSLLTKGLHLKVLPFLSAGVAIFKHDRWIHRPVALHGDTAGFRGVCSVLLLGASIRNTRNFDSVSVMKLIVSW